MRKVAELSPAEFPGTDPEKFRQWQAALKEAERRTLMLFAGLIVLNVILVLATGRLVLGGLVLLLIFFWIWRKPNRLFKELGIPSKALRAARRRKMPAESGWEDTK